MPPLLVLMRLNEHEVSLKEISAEKYGGNVKETESTKREERRGREKESLCVYIYIYIRVCVCIYT